MAVLVTGGAGYIGSHTAIALHESGREVVILDNLRNSSAAAVDAVRSLTTPDMVFVEGDAGDQATLDEVFSTHDIDEVVHFAALKAVGESAEIPLDYFANNIGSTIAVARAMLQHGVRKFVFSSSATVYGDPDTVPVAEDASTGATNPYGRTKLMSEQILRDVAAADDLDVVLLRYFNPVGAHESGTIGEDPVGIPNNLVPFVMQVAVGRREQLNVFGDDYDTPDGTCIRDYVHVVDLAEGHVAALDALDGTLKGACTAVNLGTGVGSSVLEVIAAAEVAIGAPIPKEIVGRRAGDVDRCYADPSYAQAALGWKASRDLATMLRDHWNWQSKNPHGFSSSSGA